MKTKVSKGFLCSSSEVLDDSYISTAIINNEDSVRAGFSLHDGNSSVSFFWDIAHDTAERGDSLLLCNQMTERIAHAIEKLRFELNYIFKTEEPAAEEPTNGNKQ